MNSKLFVSQFQPKRSFGKYKLGSSKLDQIGLSKIRRPSTKKHKREFLIRQLSEKSKTLSFERYGVYRHNLNYVPIKQAQQTFGTMLYPKSYPREKPGDTHTCLSRAVTKTKFLYPEQSSYPFKERNPNRLKKKSSIFSLDVTFNQLLFKSSHFYRLNTNRKLGYLYSTNLDKMSFLSSDLANLALSVKTYLFLKKKGIYKVGEFVTNSPQKLLQFLNRDTEMFAEVQRTFLLLAIRENN